MIPTTYEVRMKQLTEEQKELYKKFINEVSYYNAAESPQWGREQYARGSTMGDVGKTLLSWYDDGISLETLEKFHDENKGLTSFVEMFPFRTLRLREKQQENK